MKKISILCIAALLCCMTACENEDGVNSLDPKKEPNAPELVEAIDLGLSVKWANMNVGATELEECGDYFAWGETNPKSDYSWSTYKYCKGSSNTLTKYCTSSSYGTVDYITTLKPTDDAAHVNWGGAWRMPTKTEQEELLTQCTWTWTTQDGTKGYRIMGKNGNSIFLPMVSGYYWSSSLGTYYRDDHAYAMYFKSETPYNRDWVYDNRYKGRPVRPVCP